MKKFILYPFLALLIIEAFGFLLSALDIEPTGFQHVLNLEWYDSKNAYADRDSLVGVWHEPNDQWLQNGPCFTTEMFSNQFGARDNKWDTAQKGYLFLGSSFIEGYGVPYGKRISEKFERLTNKEVFNCGMSGTFTPVQYFQTLHKFKKILEFDTCFVFFILPNDEGSITEEDKGRYRPYLKDDQIVYTKNQSQFSELKPVKEKVQLFVAQYSYSYHLFDYFKNRNLLKSKLLKKEQVTTTTEYPNLSKIMEMFCNEFPEKYFYFVMLPTLNASNNIPKASFNNMKTIDLRNVLRPSEDYFTCNSHWNANGHEKVAAALYSKLQ